MSSSPPALKELSLMPSAALLIAAAAVSLAFAALFEPGPVPRREVACGTPAATAASTPPAGGHDATHHAEDGAETGPTYFAGGLWSRELGLGPLVELGVLSLAPGQTIVCESVGWRDGQLVVIDRSPLLQQAGRGTDAGLVVLSVDHQGPDPSPAFVTAVQEHLAEHQDAQAVLVFAPLPGPTPRGEDAFAYDWTVLWTEDNIELIDWGEFGFAYDKAAAAKTNLLNFFRQWQGRYGEPANAEIPAFQDMPSPALIERFFNATDRAARASARRELATRDPYKVVPALDAWMAQSPKPHKRHLYEQLQLRRAMGVQANKLIQEAAALDSPLFRKLAARAIGDLSAVTQDPIGRLTLLAEDTDMAVRYEALAACLAVPSRHAAGVAQLVEPYEMDIAMRAFYRTAMATLLAYGEPVPADSKANRLRRMPIEGLLKQDRTALVCTILLERTDLPDDQIDAVLAQLSDANGNSPLVALLNTLSTMNPRTLARRGVLLETLVGWKTNELLAQHPRLAEITKSELSPDLRAASAAAILRSSASSLEALASTGLTPVLFEGSARVATVALPSGWPQLVFDTAFSAEPKPKAVQVAAIDAIKHLPETTKTTENIQRLLEVARGAQDIEIRFAAIRAVNALPDSIRPDAPDLSLTAVTVAAVPGTLRYDKTRLSVVAGRPVELTLSNPDTMEHNLIITRPRQGQAVGIAGAAMGAEAQYVPELDAVLFYTPLVKPGRSYTLRFVAPSAPGEYDYVCTFPGHPAAMNGILEVLAP